MTFDGKSLFHCLINPPEGDPAASPGPRTRRCRLESSRDARTPAPSRLLSTGVFPSTQDLITELNRKGKYFPLGKLLRMIKGCGLLSALCGEGKGMGTGWMKMKVYLEKKTSTDLPRFHGLSQRRTGWRAAFPEHAGCQSQRSHSPHQRLPLWCWLAPGRKCLRFLLPSAADSAGAGVWAGMAGQWAEPQPRSCWESRWELSRAGK